MLTWKQRADYPAKGKGKVDFPGAKGTKGIPEGSSVPKASTAKGSDYPGKKGDKGTSTGKGGKAGKAPRD